MVAECAQLLKLSQLAPRLSWLVRLYESHGQHKAALDLMRVKSKEMGLGASISYLARLAAAVGNPHEKLVLHFSGWLLGEAPSDALRVFCLADTQMTPLRVVDHLEWLIFFRRESRARCSATTW